MGVQIKDILEYREVDLSFFSNKRIAFDTFNMLYQFLSSIRQPDGTSLKDSKGEVTSHLKGLFYRCVYFKKNNIKAVFVFDGKSPKLKEKEQEMRRQKKIEADKKYREALELGLMEEANKYAKATSKLDARMIEESKELIRAFGFEVLEAPSEGEAQAAYLANQNLVFTSSSQDFDSLLFGAKNLVRNMSISAKRKMPGTSVYKDVPIEFYDLEANLKNLDINREELIIIAMLCGTDFNPKGIHGIGPKKALKLVKEYRNRWDELFETLDWHSSFDYPWIDVFNVFMKMPIKEVDEFDFKDMNKTKVLEILGNRDFDVEILKRSLDKIKNVKTLDSFF